MRGWTHILGFALLGGIALWAGSYLATHPVWCGDHQGISPTNTCGEIVHDSIGFAVQLVGVGVVALLAILLVANSRIALNGPTAAAITSFAVLGLLTIPLGLEAGHHLVPCSDKPAGCDLPASLVDPRLNLALIAVGVAGLIALSTFSRWLVRPRHRL